MVRLSERDQPDRSADNVEQHVGQHRVLNPMVAVQPSEEQPECAVEQEAAQQKHGRQSPERLERRRKVSSCKGQRRQDVCGDQYAGRHDFLCPAEQLPSKEGKQAHEKQPQHHLFDHTTIQDGSRPSYAVKGTGALVALGKLGNPTCASVALVTGKMLRKPVAASRLLPSSFSLQLSPIS